ncbi:transglutaminase family protein [Mangrovibacterium sp.]|uniref:transglutaminase-like domain-containing protein n=1 Tax=Mangrovibacterium sp. TaxID=1961364 RepID=UPI003566C9D3
MKQHSIAIFLIICFLLGTACSNQHLVSDSKKRDEIRTKFEQRESSFLKNRQAQLLDIFQSGLTLQEEEALQFLYAYETLSDLCNYNSDFYIKQVRYALKAKQTFPWGNKVSEEDFLHFVLPPRAGTENLDSARAVMFYALKDRVKGLSMKEAALEVNHWCHEKVTYVGSDSRTSAPLATMKNAKGRCGEESVFTVTALRSVGIPARQIYTPRWAHQDDNHAWVEFWVDGKWYFYGACEPQADVNQGWFVEPSRRAMLTAAQTPGNYAFPDIISSNENYTRLNLIENYTNAKDLVVKVVDSTNVGIQHADVGFLISNYAELYELASLKTNSDGLCRLKLGLGDVVVWASMNNHFGFTKVTVAETDTVRMVLGGTDFSERSVEFDLVPPVQKEPLTVSETGVEENRKRLAFEDSIRNAYEQTFMTKERAFELAKIEKLDTTMVWQFLKKSRGNWTDISDFIRQAPSDYKKWVLPLLSEISDKDLRDAPNEILLSHLTNSPAYDNRVTTEDYMRYVVNPRIGQEQLSAYKTYLKAQFDDAFWQQAIKNPATIEKWIVENISLTGSENYIWVPATPKGVFEMKIADRYSAKIFFVAMCRTAGILSRLEPATGVAQYRKDDQWMNVNLEDKQPETEVDFGSIRLVNASPSGQAIRYSKEFSIAKFEHGRFKTLDFEFNKDLSRFPEKLTLQAGNYLLYTCDRQSDGTVLSRLSFFPLEKGEHKELQVSVRNEVKTTEPIATFELPDNLMLPDGEKLKLDQCSINRDVILVWLDPDKEPSKHVLKDFEDLKDSFDALDVAFVFLLPNAEQFGIFRQLGYKLPANSFFVVDDQLLNRLADSVGEDFSNQLPVLAGLAANEDVFFLSSGYKIGIGDRLLRELKWVRK